MIPIRVHSIKIFLAVITTIFLVYISNDVYDIYLRKPFDVIEIRNNATHNCSNKTTRQLKDTRYLSTVLKCEYAWEDEPVLTKIGINFPLGMTSTNHPAQTFEQLPLFEILLPSIVKSVEVDKFQYSIYVAIDKGDRLLDNCTTMKQMRNYWRDMHKSLGVIIPIQFLVYGNTRSRNTWATNYATLEAYERGWDYFYRVNDDTKLFANNWSSIFVDTLKGMKPISNLGVVWPADWRINIATHSMVHRKHWEIFGIHFPPLLGNSYSDNWIGDVYQLLPWGDQYKDNHKWLMSSNMSVKVNHVPVDHINVPLRYNGTASESLFYQQLEIDRNVLFAYINRIILS